MNFQKVVSPFIMVLLLCLPVYVSALTAFPGAQGFGANSAGGRGGAVIKVTNLNDSGPGSLRAAVETSGPRIIVFTVSGYINLDSILEIREPYFTIAGQTSPGGIAVTGYPVRVLTHDVIITHMRFRRGSHKGDPEKEGESLYIGNGYNIIVDHCSMSWGIDETMQVGAYWGDAYGVTISWSIIAEGLLDPHPEDNHGMGLLISDKFYDVKAPEVSLHHNYFAHHYARAPEFDGNVLIDYRNNITYDWYRQQGPMLIKANIDADIGKIPRSNIVSNYFKCGPNGSDTGCAGFFSSNISGTVLTDAKNSVYVSNNTGSGSGRPLGTEDEWQITYQWGFDLISNEYQKLTPWDMTVESQSSNVAVTTKTMTDDYPLEILKYVGATGPFRDTADARVIQEFIDGNGDLVNDVSYPGDFPVFSLLAPPTDSDSDGMSDIWESSRGLKVSENDSTGDDDGDGYTNIEEYLHYLSALAEIPAPNPPTNVIVE